MAEPKKMGRPRLEEPKNKNIQVRFTEGEYGKIKKCADDNNLSITQFVRQGTLIKLESYK